MAVQIEVPIHQLRNELDLSIVDLARLLEVDPTTIACCEGRGACPRPPLARAKSALLQEVRARGLTVYTLEGFRLFMRTPLPVLASRTPLQAIEQDRIGHVLAALAADYEGLGW